LGDFAVVDVSVYGKAPREEPMCYPGERPGFSYLYHKGMVHELRLFGKVWDSQLTWNEGTKVLQDVLTEEGLGNLEDWYCILAYGSNACPAQLKNKKLDTVVVVKCRMFDVLPVYAGYNSESGYVPATLARAKGEEIETWVTLLRPQDLKKMDRSEGRPSFYNLMTVDEGRLFLENGKEIKPIYAYVTTDDKGLFLHGGKVIQLNEVDQKKVQDWLKHEKLKRSETSIWLSVTPFDGPPPKVFGAML
jgi:hypothetical protein